MAQKISNHIISIIFNLQVTGKFKIQIGIKKLILESKNIFDLGTKV